MAEQRHYTTKRRIRYLEEIGILAQVGAIVDELRAMREGQQAPSFTDLLAKIDTIKTEVPKS